MYYFPNDRRNFRNKNLEKINSYLELYSENLSILKSVLITKKEDLKNISSFKKFLNSDFCTLRYQYIEPCSSPIRGGDKVRIDYEILKEKWNKSCFFWILEPTERESNLFNINITYFPERSEIIFEILGKGFDISDLNRNDIQPHQIIKLENIFFESLFDDRINHENDKVCSKKLYNDSIEKRTKKLLKLNINVSNENFNLKYEKIPKEILNKIFIQIRKVLLVNKEKNLTISTSILKDGRMIFWDIQKDFEKVKRFSTL